MLMLKPVAIVSICFFSRFGGDSSSAIPLQRHFVQLSLIDTGAIRILCGPHIHSPPSTTPSLKSHKLCRKIPQTPGPGPQTMSCRAASCAATAGATHKCHVRKCSPAKRKSWTTELRFVHGSLWLSLLRSFENVSLTSRLCTLPVALLNGSASRKRNGLLASDFVSWEMGRDQPCQLECRCPRRCLQLR